MAVLQLWLFLFVGASALRINVRRSEIGVRCRDIISNARSREGIASRLKENVCKCPKGTVIEGEAAECYSLRGQRYFPKTLSWASQCRCEAPRATAAPTRRAIPTTRAPSTITSTTTTSMTSTTTASTTKTIEARVVDEDEEEASDYVVSHHEDDEDEDDEGDEDEDVIMQEYTTAKPEHPQMSANEMTNPAIEAVVVDDGEEDEEQYEHEKTKEDEDDESRDVITHERTTVKPEHSEFYANEADEEDYEDERDYEDE